jgi:predicted DNA-binding transcriptional regulator
VRRVEIHRIRSEVRDQFRIRDVSRETDSFKRAIAAEVLIRRGLSQREVGEVLELTDRGVSYCLKVIRSRIEGSREFEKYVDQKVKEMPPAMAYQVEAMLTRWG